MANFLNFIEDDIVAKKTLLSTMPTRTKTNIKKFNEKIDSILISYNEYKTSVRKYIITKSKSFNVKIPNADLNNLTKTVNDLEEVRLLLNPTNSYFEKMGFDTLLFDIRNFSDFNFNSMNEVINQFLLKFEEAGIIISYSDFDYTFYVREYMSSFLELRNINTGNYDNLSKIFEKIYWENPEIIQHIEINFRKLIRKHRKKLIAYITNLQKEVMWKSGVTNYKECLDKLKTAYSDLNIANIENISDIIDLAVSGQIDINSFREDNRTRISNYNSMMIEEINFDDQDAVAKFHKGLEKLKTNIEEYTSFTKFMPLFADFKKEYEKLIPGSDAKNSKGTTMKSKDLEKQIINKEAKLSKINKKIFNGNTGFFDSKNNVSIKQLKLDSIILAKQLFNLYREYDEEIIKEKILLMLNKFLTVPELLHLYYSYDFFKKKAIKKIFELTKYDDVIKYSNEFDKFAKNPNNIIINGVSVFAENNIAKIIVNKYRLDNINLLEDNLEPDELETLLEKIQYLLRINEVENSKTNVDKIWFKVEVEKIITAEKKAEGK